MAKLIYFCKLFAATMRVFSTIISLSTFACKFYTDCAGQIVSIHETTFLVQMYCDMIPLRASLL